MRFQIVGGGHGSRVCGLSMIKTTARRKMAGLESICECVFFVFAQAAASVLVFSMPSLHSYRFTDGCITVRALSGDWVLRL